MHRLLEQKWRFKPVLLAIQFNDKAQTFKISRVVPPAECENFYTEQVDQDTYHFTGEYKVEDSSKKRKAFGSVSTIGFPGEYVRIVLETE